MIMIRKPTILFIPLLLLLGCDQPDPVVDYAAEARRIAETSIIVDTHIDLPLRLHSKSEDVTQPTASGDFDYPRAVAGGLNAPFMSIYTDPGLESEGQSRIVAEELIDIVEALAKEASDKFAIARSPAEVRNQFEHGLMSLPMGMENGSPIEGDLANVEYFHNRGISYITLAHGKSNHISDSSYDANHQWNGLSEFGMRVVKEMNRVGIMVDISHVSDEAFWQVMDVSTAPVIASHSSARYFTPGFERNMNDEMIKRLADEGGVIQINFGSGFISKEAMDYSAPRQAAAMKFMAENPGMTYADLAKEFLPQFEAEHGGFPYASIDDVLDHFDHVVNLVGVDHVGIGSDYDGVGDTLPTGLKDVSAYPNLIEGFLKRGYSESDIRKILGENLLRVWSEVEARADVGVVN
jgi:membrane dipeptidase